MNKKAKLIPLHRIADPIEIANIIYLFTTEALSFCTGTVIDIAGGELGKIKFTVNYYKDISYCKKISYDFNRLFEKPLKKS